MAYQQLIMFAFIWFSLACLIIYLKAKNEKVESLLYVLLVLSPALVLFAWFEWWFMFGLFTGSFLTYAFITVRLYKVITGKDLDHESEDKMFKLIFSRNPDKNF